MAKYNLKRIDLHVPQYNTDATISVDENHSSGTPHLVTKYNDIKGVHHGHSEVAAAIPDDWTDKDILDLISLPPRMGTGRDWPSWEIPASDYASAYLFRFWKGEKAPDDRSELEAQIQSDLKQAVDIAKKNTDK
ncbi:hypothetical protein [Bradyrhizobium neotropicale]|uniref:Uncharacterized protein n=1 Tax=Bradyrhizobium neotropicale TaxID=1497615 RepID=A0A176ZDE8_9BRAD|nr:hypothetical protein [Bradyrhizobium neotropicale]OAF17863.1 hypothetical protein AXW67_07005 [Bradyrhizobium neotropicale]